MQENKINLQCKRVKFYSSYDENAFFEWIKKIKSITTFEGMRDVIVLTVTSKKISDEDLHELFGLFRRYKIRTNQLEIFIDPENQEALSWHRNGSHFNMYPAKPSR